MVEPGSRPAANVSNQFMQKCGAAPLEPLSKHLRMAVLLPKEARHLRILALFGYRQLVRFATSS
jgi:hypothetical protein